MDEVWKDIEGYEGLYQISNLGRVRSLDRKIEYSNGHIVLHKGKMLKPFPDKGREYLNVNLNKNGKNTKFRINRLVALAFISNEEHKSQVNHKDENKQNNRVDNLEWVTPKENSNWGTRSLRSGLSRRKAIWGYNIINGSIIEFNSLAEAEKVGFGHSTISACLHHRKHQAYGYKWFFKE